MKPLRPLIIFLFFSACTKQSTNSSERMGSSDSLIKPEIKIPKQNDTVFIKYDKDWTSDKLNYVTDTFFSKSGMTRNLLVGTTILNASQNQFESKWMYGLRLSKVSKSDCLKTVDEMIENGEKTDNKVNSIISTDTTLRFDINIYDNCCYDFVCDVSIVDKNIINLISLGYGTHCDCDCCYGLTFEFFKETMPAYKTMKSVMINGDRKTLRPIK